MLGINEKSTSSIKNKNNVSKSKNNQKNKNKTKKSDINKDISNIVTLSDKDIENNAYEHIADNNKKSGLPNKNYFIEKYNNNIGNIYNIKDFYLQDVMGDGNCGYRCIASQIYEDENKYYIVRENIYQFLKKL